MIELQLSIDRIALIAYVILATLAYHSSLDFYKSNFILYGGGLAFAYYWGVCLPPAFRILFDGTRLKKIGVSGVVHIVSSIIALITGLLIGALAPFSPLSKFISLDPSSNVMLIQGAAGCISMISSWFMFHILPKASKKLYRRFLLSSFTTLPFSFYQIVLWVDYNKNVLGKEVSFWLEPFSSPVMYLPVVLPISAIAFFGNIFNSFEEIWELVNCVFPDAKLQASDTPRLRMPRRSSSSNHGALHNTARSFVKSDLVSRASGRRISFSNDEAHSVSRVDWPQIFMAGSDITISSAAFLFSLKAMGGQEELRNYVLFKSGAGMPTPLETLTPVVPNNDVSKNIISRLPSVVSSLKGLLIKKLFFKPGRSSQSITLGSTGDENAEGIMSQYIGLQTTFALIFVYYAGVVFPTSLVLKGKLSSKQGRFLIVLYALASGALTPYVSDYYSLFYNVIAATYGALAIVALPRLAKVGLAGFCPFVPARDKQN